ncbi:MAG: T9SS type A sorting domain-containing protein [candidate division Zixibacteria bacterium]|nr:T9SS type A sorting domain-containing protein [candidate division Zixibacteria bacterium]
MMNRSMMLSFAVLVLLLMTATAPASQNQNILSIEFPSGDYEIKSTADGQRVILEDYGCLLVPGKPILPSKTFAIAIPPGAEIVDVNYITGRAVNVSNSIDIQPSPLPRVIGEENPAIYEVEKQRYENNYKSVYGKDKPYPENLVEFVGKAGYRRYNLADIRVTPFEYKPQSRQLFYYPDVSVQIKYRFNGNDEIYDYSVKSEQVAEKLILNYNEAQNWYSQNFAMDDDFHDFVIITTSSLASSITSLVDWETSKGRCVEVVTTSWIDMNYEGYDTAEKMRNFLMEKYPSSEWGIQDVLLIGHYDDVPMRRTAQDLGYGAPETDYYYAELSLPDSQSWDIDGDHQYGEDSDGHDFYTEVNVGRIPWSTPSTVESICEKSVFYEINDDPSFKKNILLLGAFFWDNDPNPRTDNAVLMEAKVNQTWMSDWTKTRMYEEGYSGYPMDFNLTNSNVVDVWSNSTFAFVNWAGHGSPTSSHIYHGGMNAFISSGNCSQLNDEYPSIIFADACSNSDTDYPNIGQMMMRQGGVGFLGATKVALGCPGWTNWLSGSSQSLDYLFTTYVTSGEHTIGEAHQKALSDMHQFGLWDYLKYETYEWGAIWGNPNLGMAPIDPHPLTILFPYGLPELIAPGITTSFTLRIEEGGENYLAGSGRLHYRYDDGEFLTTELIDVEDDLYEAVLPVTGCEDTPEYYFSASGDNGSNVLSPADAPNSVYTAVVGEMIMVVEDNFETDLGWTVSGDALEGHWERGIPVGAGDRGDPTADYDGSGQCYLTWNETGNSDVDDGVTELTSPMFLLGDIEQAEVTYALWYTNFFGDNPNEDVFRTYFSNDDGESWIVADTVGPGSTVGWNVSTIVVNDILAPTNQFRIRFDASDYYGGSLVEAGIDAFKITKLDCEETSIPDELEDTNLPNSFALMGNYPNPFNNKTTIIYALPEASRINLSIYNILGQKVATLVNSRQQAGYKSVNWDATDYSSGVYFTKLTAGDKVFTKRLTLLK